MSDRRAGQLVWLLLAVRGSVKVRRGGHRTRNRHTGRFPEPQIKAAIQHPEQDVRLTALQYFTDSPAPDASVMPHVIRAVELVLGDADDLTPDQLGLRHRLVATAIIMGARFPEFEEWHPEAIASNYGRFSLETPRIAENF